MGDKDKRHPFSGFWRIRDRGDRLERLVAIGAIRSDHAELLRRGDISVTWGMRLIENFIGYFQIPLGIVCLSIDGRTIFIPYANEETSVVAAANNAGSKIREYGATIATEIIGDHFSMGQIIIIVPSSKIEEAIAIISEKERELIEFTNKNCPVLKNDLKRGGGVRKIHINNTMDGITEGCTVISVHVHIDTIDAQGANKVTSVCEFISTELKKSIECEVIMSILSNLVDKAVGARVELKGFDKKRGRLIQIASRVSNNDVYRAATELKGQLNALSAIAKATGNDDRALAATFITHCVMSGSKTATTWIMEGDTLVGTFEAPIDVGTFGGAIVHPMAQVALGIMGVKTAKELRRIMAAAALAQNYAALYALTDPDVRFSQGHQGLNADNLALQAGAVGDEIDKVVIILKETLKERGVSAEDARNALEQIREKD